MNEVKYIHTLKQLMQYMNEKGIIEIAIRDRKKKFSSFQKIVIDNKASETAQEQIRNAIFKLNKNNSLSKKSIALMEETMKLQRLGIGLDAFNIFATCVGFAIMYAKLDKISGQIDEVMSTVKQGQDIKSAYEFHKILSEHANMLDARKIQKYYTEDQMRKLVDDEYNLLNMLIEVYRKNYTADKETLTVSISAMASMMTVSLRYFDELYYLNNREVIGDGNVWHSSHDNWTSVYKKLSSDEFLELVQDHGVFDLGLSMYETDVYSQIFFGQVKDMEETVADNQQLLVELGSADLMEAFEAYVDHDVEEAIRAAFEQTEGALENPEVLEAYQRTMKQMGLAV